MASDHAGLAWGGDAEGRSAERCCSGAVTRFSALTGVVDPARDGRCLLRGSWSGVADRAVRHVVEGAQGGCCGSAACLLVLVLGETSVGPRGVVEGLACS